jgi:hypothetical protein
VVGFITGSSGELPGKGKIVPVFLAEHHVMKAYWGSGGIVTLIL